MWKKEPEPSKIMGGQSAKPEPKKPDTQPHKERSPMDTPRTSSSFPSNPERAGSRKENLSLEPTVISRETTLSGDISGKADIKVLGKFQGNIEVPQNVVSIETTGYVKAKISAKFLNVHGKLFGDATIYDTAHLHANCLVEGDLQTKGVIVDSGSHFNGSVEMMNDKDNEATPSAGEGAKSRQKIPSGISEPRQSAPKEPTPKPSAT